MLVKIKEISELQIKKEGDEIKVTTVWPNVSEVAPKEYTFLKYDDMEMFVCEILKFHFGDE